METQSDIGGYFGLDLPDHGCPFAAAMAFQSGRAALRAVLESAAIPKVLVPAYICDAVIQGVTDAGAAVETYRLDDSLYPKDVPDPFPERCALLYVNYFGLCEANVYRLRRDIPRGRLIIDNSQALLAPPTDGLATIYSPRKSVGVPDGGLLVTSEPDVKEPEHEDTHSVDRMKHLLLRIASTAHDGYPDYVEAEKAFRNTKPLRMSRLTRRILASVDMRMVKRRRRENFMALAARLDKYNIHEWGLDPDAVPFCYPLILASDIRPMVKALAGKGIYVPTYWPDARPRVSEGIEWRLTNCCLPVPCDQRYSLEQMSLVANEIDSGLDSIERR